MSYNPYNYESHKKLISLYRNASELEYLRQARRNLHEMLPLRPEDWMEWIEDEKNIAQTDSELHEMVSIYKSAMKDYFCKRVFVAINLKTLFL